MARSKLYREIKGLWAGPRRGAVITAAGVLAVLLLGWWQAGGWYRARLLADQHDRVITALIPYGNSLATILNQHFAQLEGLAAFALANPTRAELTEKFAPFAAGLYSGKKSLRAIQIFPPTGTIFVHPVAGNEAALNRTLADLINDERPAVRVDVQRAIETRRIALSGPYQLRQGGFGLVARQAVYPDNALWGMAVVVIDLPPVFRDAGLETPPPGMNLALRDAAGQTVFGADAVFAAEPALYHLEFPEGRWELAAMPAGGWLPAIQTPLLVFQGVGLVLTGLVTGLVYLVVNRQARLMRAVQARTVALAESEARYRQLFDNNADALFLVDNRGYVVDANQVACQRYGYSRTELVQMTVHDLSAPELRHKAPARVQSALAGSTRFEWRHCRKDGRELPVEINTGPLQLDNQTYILSSVRDISAWVEAERALRESEERYRLLFNNSLDAVILSAPDGRILTANPAACRIFGRTEAELCAVGRAGVVDSADPRLAAALAERAQTGKFSGELTFIRKDGTKFPGEISSAVFTDQEGQQRTSILVRDITERKRVETALRQSEQRLLSIYDAVGDVIFLLDVEQGERYRFSSVNQAFLSVTGLGYEDVVGKFVDEVIPEPSLSMVLEKYQEAIRARQLVRWEETSTYPTGTLTGEVSIGPVFDEAGVCTHLVGAVHDITQQRRDALALREKDILLQETSRLAKIGGWEFDVDTLQGTWTEEVARIHGLDPNDETNVEIGLSFYHGDSRRKIEAALQNAINLDQPYDLELELVTAAGTRKWVRTIGQPVKADNRVVKVRGMFQDITERKRAAEALRVNQERLEMAQAVGHVGSWEYHLATGFIWGSPEGFRIYGLEPAPTGEIPIDQIEARIPEQERVHQALVDLINEGKPYNLEFAVNPSEQEKPRIITSVAELIRDEQGNPVRVVGVIQDITARKQAEEALRQLNADLEQRVAQRTAELEQVYRGQAAEEERRRLARDLHDAVSQSLFSASLMAEALPRLWGRKPEVVAQNLTELHRLTRGALAEMRTLLLELRPDALKEVPLQELLQQLADALSGRTQAAIVLTADSQCALPGEVKNALYRIAQEALNNVTKHARPKTVSITLQDCGDSAVGLAGVRLTVWDDGRGFDPTQEMPGHLGLDIMQERAAAINARLTLTSAPGQGTTVEVIWP